VISQIAVCCGFKKTKKGDSMKKMLLILALVVIGLMSVSVASAALEALYLTDSGIAGDKGGVDLFTVDLVDDAGTLKANLNFVYNFPYTEGFDQVDALAASADGTTVYAIDKLTKKLGTYVVSTGVFTSVPIAGCPSGVVLAAMSPDDKLYMVSQDTDTLYEVVGYNTATPSTGPGLKITGVNVQGADIAFDPEGKLYLYSSATQRLYTVDTTTGVATLVGYTGGSFTGLAILEGGLGDLVGSSTTDDKVYVIDKETGAKGAGYCYRRLRIASLGSVSSSS